MLTSHSHLHQAAASSKRLLLTQTRPSKDQASDRGQVPNQLTNHPKPSAAVARPLGDGCSFKPVRIGLTLCCWPPTLGKITPNPFHPLKCYYHVANQENKEERTKKIINQGPFAMLNDVVPLLRHSRPGRPLNIESMFAKAQPAILRYR